MADVLRVLIVGYELEVKKVGEVVSVSLSRLELALTLPGGHRKWTTLLSHLPTGTLQTSLRRWRLGVSLYLLANFYSIIHTTIGLRIRGAEGNLESKGSPGRRLQKARSKVYVKELMLLAGLRQHSTFTAWEPTFGGKFPKQQYDAIIEEVNK